MVKRTFHSLQDIERNQELDYGGQRLSSISGRIHQSDSSESEGSLYPRGRWIRVVKELVQNADDAAQPSYTWVQARASPMPTIPFFADRPFSC